MATCLPYRPPSLSPAGFSNSERQTGNGLLDQQILTPPLAPDGETEARVGQESWDLLFKDLTPACPPSHPLFTPLRGLIGLGEGDLDSDLPGGGRAVHPW